MNKLSRDIERILRDAGFELSRDNRHTVWESRDGKRGVAFSRNIREKHLVRSLLRSAGIEARL